MKVSARRDFWEKVIMMMLGMLGLLILAGLTYY